MKSFCIALYTKNIHRQPRRLYDSINVCILCVCTKNIQQLFQLASYLYKFCIVCTLFVNSSNYRPISLLPKISKILEKAMYSRLYKSLDKFDCLYNKQFRFRYANSTNHAIISITEEIAQLKKSTRLQRVLLLCLLIFRRLLILLIIKS